MSETLICSICGQEKPANKFRLRNSRKRGCTSACKKCLRAKYDWRTYNKNYWVANKDKARNLQLQHHYGISLLQYNEMFNGQNGCCLICGRHQSQLKRTFHVDHNKNTGQVRGLLCASCNRGVGYLQDSSELCLKAAQYLSK